MSTQRTRPRPLGGLVGGAGRRSSVLTIGARVAVTAALVLSIFALGPATASHALVAPLRIVAVGDSYASGEGAPGPAWIDSSCHRSPIAGPQDAAARLNVFPQSFMSFACSGATTSSLLGPNGQFNRLPVGPIDALTISIGGNDIGFAEVVKTCVSTPPNLMGCDALDASVSNALADLPAALLRVFAAVPARVSNVFVTQYPDPTTGAGGALCGTIESPAFHGLEGISAAEAAWASSRIVDRLNATLRAAVDAANDRLPEPHPVFHFVNGISFRFFRHGYCTGLGSPAPWAWPNPRFIATPVDSLTRQGDPNGTMHPNDLGQQAIGEVLAAAMSFLVKPLRLQVIASATPVIGVPVELTVHVSTAAGTPVPRADVRIDGTRAGTTDQTGKLTLTRTFTSAGDHTATVDHNPYPAVSTSFAVNSYTVTSNPSPIPVDRAVTLSLQATDQSNHLVPGTFTLTSGTGTVSIRSGTSATVTLGTRYEHEWELDDDGKPVRVTTRICPEIVFQPDNSVLEPRDTSDLDDCP
jgi:lysophospholipase L1-like esterase